MGINSSLCWELIDPVMGVCNNRNAGLTLDADLALLVVDADFSNTELLRLVFEVRRRVSQTRL